MKLHKVKRMRFLLLHDWLTHIYEPHRVADVGGGKGLLTYLLNKSGWDSTVIDPNFQSLPAKYKELNRKKHKISPNESVPYIKAAFSTEMVKEFDLIIGLHAHGCNRAIIDGCKQYNKDFLLLPCCVIDEPIDKQPDVDWTKSLREYAEDQGLEVKQVKFNFAGNNIALYTDRFLRAKPKVDAELINSLYYD